MVLSNADGVNAVYAAKEMFLTGLLREAGGIIAIVATVGAARLIAVASGLTAGAGAML